MTYFLDPRIRQAAGNSIFVSGVTRTGTTIVGMLIHSLDRVEYAHEPPFLWAHIPLIREMAEASWRLLFESYVFEDILMDGLAARHLNFNSHDESCVYRAKAREEIADRLALSHRRSTLFPLALEHRPAFKVPDMLPYLAKLSEYYPALSAVVMVRRPEHVFVSMLERGWYSDAGMSDVTGIWPFRRPTPPYVPFWVDDPEAWLRGDELTRLCQYYIAMYGDLVPTKQVLFLDYDRFVANPRRRFGHLAEKLGAKFGTLTDDLLGEVGERNKDRHLDLSSVPASLLRRLRETADRVRELAAVHERE